MPVPPVFSYYSNLFFDKAYDQLLLDNAHSEFGVSPALQFFWVAVARLADIFKVDTRVEINVPYLAALKDPDSAFDLVLSLMACETMRCIN